jgi:hypothetical protein
MFPFACAANRDIANREKEKRTTAMAAIARALHSRFTSLYQSQACRSYNLAAIFLGAVLKDHSRFVCR